MIMATPITIYILLAVAAGLAGYLLGSLLERRRLHKFVDEERALAKQQIARADRAVDALVEHSGGVPISFEGQQRRQEEQERADEMQNEVDEIYATETGAEPPPEEPPE